MTGSIDVRINVVDGFTPAIRKVLRDIHFWLFRRLLRRNKGKQALILSKKRLLESMPF